MCATTYPPHTPLPIPFYFPTALGSHLAFVLVLGRSTSTTAGGDDTQPGSKPDPAGPRASLIFCSAAAVYCWTACCVSVVCSSCFCRVAWVASTKSLVQSSSWGWFLAGGSMWLWWWRGGCGMRGWWLVAGCLGVVVVVTVRDRLGCCSRVAGGVWWACSLRDSQRGWSYTGGLFERRV